jgi:glycosyltransferase involved in cell wall biosynthesis
MIINPKISIVTPSFNQGLYIKDTIESVLNQDYDNWEHIIIDGGSKDETIDILKEYSHIKWISEKDLGPANALNKGFNMADGEILAWINADDLYENNIFRKIAGIFSGNPIDLLFGMVTFIYPETGEKIPQIMEEIHLNNLIHNSADSIRQPGVFFTREIFNAVGGLDESLKLVFDYDLIIKMLKIGVKMNINNNIAFQRMYKETLTKRNLSTQAFEIFRVSRKNGARFTDAIIVKSVLRKLFFPGKF